MPVNWLRVHLKTIIVSSLSGHFDNVSFKQNSGGALKKKHAIIKTACRLFADQGFAGTSTLQISREAGATEPLIFYHFDGKDALFTYILETSFAEYFIQLDALPDAAETQFEKIENLISMHLEFLKEMPHETKLIVSTCPAKLKDPDHICADNFARLRERIISYLTECLSNGIKSGEFREMSISDTANILIALINGLIRQQVYKLDDFSGIRGSAVSFCRFSLVNL